MKVAVLATDSQWNEINDGLGEVVYYRVETITQMCGDAGLILDDSVPYDFTNTTLALLINAVSVTLQEMGAPKNVFRINAWNGFLTRPTWEIAGAITEGTNQLLTALGKQAIHVPDEPGFVSARVLAMIINEAYFALEDKVSTREDIDLAMKLGTGYPYGPFEWASIIGIGNIYRLLEKLSLQDKRYRPAGLLKSAAQ